MRLDELNENEKATIKRIDADEVLKHRLFSFGVIKGATLKVKAFSPKKKTIEIEINRSRIALRLDEAKKIEVEKLEKCK